MTRRTNILIGGEEVLHSLAAKNLTGVNGDVSIDVSTLENPVRIGSVWLRDNAGTLETSTNGVTWMGIGGVDMSQYAKTADLASYALKTDLTPYALNADLQAHINDATVHGGGGTPTAYALSWAGVTDSTTKITRALPGAWINGNLQLWMRLYLDATTAGSYIINAQSFNFCAGSDGALGIEYITNSEGDWGIHYDSRVGVTGWHDIGLQWTQASNSAIIYIDGVGGTPISASKDDVDTGGAYTLEVGAAKIKLSAFAWANALTWSAGAATQETIGTLTVNLPLTEGSGATATDSTGTAWTIPAGVVWEAL